MRAADGSEIYPLEAWAGEVRVNFLRLLALIGFYGHHLVNVYLYRDDPHMTAGYHAAATAICIAWATAVLVLYVCLSRRWNPPGLKYAATLWDTAMITLLLVVSPEGPKSPLNVLYFLVIAAAPLRLCLRLVYVAALGAMAAYLIALGHFAWFRIGYEKYYAEAANRIPRVNQFIFLLALGAAGLLAGQIVRQMRRIMRGYPVHVADSVKE